MDRDTILTFSTEEWGMRGNVTRHSLIIGLILASGTALLSAPAHAQSTLDPALAFGLISNGSVTLDANASVSGTVGAIKDLTLKKSAFVSADSTALGKKLKLDSSATVNGI